MGIRTLSIASPQPAVTAACRAFTAADTPSSELHRAVEASNANFGTAH
jgi:hypothetical protein